MFWNKNKQATSINDQFHLQIKRNILLNRVRNALKDTTDYDLRLRNFMLKNHHNQKLIVDIVGHMSYMKTSGYDVQQAAKATLEEFQH